MRTLLHGALIGLILIVSCGTNTPGRIDKLSDPAKKYEMQGTEYIFLDKGNLQIETNSLSGDGRIIFKEPRPVEDTHFSLAFNLKDLGNVTLTSNANASLEKGVNLNFGRKSAQLTVTLSVGNENYDLSSDFAALKADENQTFEIEIHGHGHVIVRRGKEHFEYAFSTRVAGKLWGLTLKGATVTRAQASKATEGH